MKILKKFVRYRENFEKISKNNPRGVAAVASLLLNTAVNADEVPANLDLGSLAQFCINNESVSLDLIKLIDFWSSFILIYNLVFS